MNITLVDGSIRTTGAFWKHVAGKLDRALHRFSERVDDVQVSIHDENGPKGGEDKRCIIRGVLRGLGPIQVEENGTDYYAVFDQATHRFKQTLARRVDRQRH